MSDPQIPPPDPESVERDDTPADEDVDRSENPAPAGVGPALFVRPAAADEPQDDENDGSETDAD